MNPWALVIIGIGILLMIVGIKGTQHNLSGAVTNKNSGNSTSTNTGVGSKGPVV